MPQITFDITDAQLKQVDDLNAARNQKLAAGAQPSSRQTFAAAAIGPALEAAIAHDTKEAAKVKDKPKDAGK
ncbi:MAG: hypothetical protein ABI639_17615 [Thermoanaerobaculia bacterium]